MLKRIGLGLIFAFSTTVSFVVIFKYQKNTLSYFNDLLLIPQVLFDVAFVLIIIVLAKWYKLCVREDEVNIFQIVDEHYERYMDQEEDYRREMGLVHCVYIHQSDIDRYWWILMNILRCI